MKGANIALFKGGAMELKGKEWTANAPYTISLLILHR